MLEFLTSSPQETIALGERLGAELLDYGVVLTLDGDLGAGKTHLVKGFAGSLGLNELSITSPTFALANEYEGLRQGLAFMLYHLDCYRFEKPEELLELGVEDYLFPKMGATIVEWPERIAQYLPEKRIEIRLTSLSETARRVTVNMR